MPLRVSCLGPVLRLACWGGGRPGPVSAYLAWGCALPVGWVQAWGPVTNPTARAFCKLALRAGLTRCKGGMRAPEGRLLPGCGACGVGRSPTSDHSSFLACGRGPIPTGCGCGGCGRGDPSTTPQHALLRARFARCGGGMRVPGCRGLLPGCGASGVGRSPTPDHSSLRACGRGQPPSGCRRGGWGRGDPSTTPQRALLRAGFARCGGGMWVPGDGASCLGVGRPGWSALPPWTTRPFRRAAGAHYPLAMGAGDAGVGTRHQPHSAHSCVLALRASRGGMRVPGGGASCLGVGRPGSGTLQPPTTRPFERAAGAPYPLAVGAGGAGVRTHHQPHSAHSCVPALRAVQAASGCPGGVPLAWVWGIRGRVLSRPRPFVRSGVRPGPTTHWLLVGGLRARGPVTNPTARALASWLCALWGRHEGARGGASRPGVGRLGLGALPLPTTLPFWLAARAHYPAAVGAGGGGVGTCHQPHSARSCEPSLRAAGAA